MMQHAYHLIREQDTDLREGIVAFSLPASATLVGEELKEWPIMSSNKETCIS